MPNIDGKALLQNPAESGLSGDDLVVALKQAVKDFSYAALENAKYYRDYIPDKDELAQLLTQAAEKAPFTTLESADKYILNIPEKDRTELLIKAADETPGVALKYPDKYKHHITKEVLTKLLVKAAKDAPYAALEYAKDYGGYIPKDELANLLTQTAKDAPNVALKYAENYAGYIPKDELANLLTQAVEKSPYMALKYAENYAGYIPDKGELAQLLVQTAEKEPGAALFHANDYADYIPKENRAKLLAQAAEKEPGTALFHADKYADYIPEKDRAELLVQAAKDDPYTALEYAKDYAEYIPKEERANLLIQTAKDDPGSALQFANEYADHILDKDELTDLLTKAARDDPKTALKSVDDYVNYIPKDKLADLLIQAAKDDPRTALRYAEDYIHHIPKNEHQDVMENAGQTLLMFMEGLTIENIALPEYLNADTLEKITTIPSMRDDALKAARELNRLHDQPDIRFDSVEKYSADDLYKLMIFGREEVYTSTYLGLFERLNNSIVEKEGGWNEAFASEDSIVKQYPQSIGFFLGMAAQYNKLNEAMVLIPNDNDQWNSIQDSFAKRIENGDTQALISLVEITNGIKAPEIQENLGLVEITNGIETINRQANFENFIQEQYDNAPLGRIKDSYAIAGSYYNSLSGSAKINITNEAHYKLPEISKMGAKALFGSDGIHRQLMVFSDDKDSKNSFNNFMKTYEGKEGYVIENHHDKYIKISAHGGPHGDVEIYANRPGSSPDNILNAIAGKDAATIKDVSFDAVTHRGHSYNLKNTMPYFSSKTNLMFLGSCGGYNNLNRLLKISGDAHISTTKQVGTMYVNDPLSYHTTNSIRKNGEIDWKKEQGYLDGLGNERKGSYVLPHKNLPAMVSQRLSGLEEERRLEEEKPQNAIAPDNPLPSSEILPERTGQPPIGMGVH
ncbi:MAG: hypothetical protein KAJ40_02460 [Alphaproteobacteria bacterium]|nr:hypothetical protein [Alphaproteobacteria bacterium]